MSLRHFLYFLSNKPLNGVKTPLVLQFSETECGIASLAMILAYYKTYLSLESLRKQCGTSRDGCKAITLMNIARRYHFTADAFKVDLNDIKNLTIPVIAYWNFNHYVVINGVRNKKVYINDPAEGEKIIGWDEFDQSFTGIVLAILPTEKTPLIKKINYFPL